MAKKSLLSKWRLISWMPHPLRVPGSAPDDGMISLATAARNGSPQRVQKGAEVMGVLFA